MRDKQTNATLHIRLGSLTLANDLNYEKDCGSSLYIAKLLFSKTGHMCNSLLQVLFIIEV